MQRLHGCLHRVGMHSLVASLLLLLLQHGCHQLLGAGAGNGAYAWPCVCSTLCCWHAARLLSSIT
jgi:hypothetical protein